MFWRGNMKKILWLLVCFLSVYSVSDGAIIGRDDANDGYLTTGEYEYSNVRVTSYSTLYVVGGGAYRITAEDHSQIDISSTSLPLSGDIDGGGVWSILMDDYSTLHVSGGAINTIYTGRNSTVTLTGGQINKIINQQSVTVGDERIIIKCCEGYDWLYEDDLISGITGNWWDGTAFTISFQDDDDYAPVYQNVKIITPEPATLTLFALGSIFLKRRR